jgi:hypothetical protein
MCIESVGLSWILFDCVADSYVTVSSAFRSRSDSSYLADVVHQWLNTEPPTGERARAAV